MTKPVSTDRKTRQSKGAVGSADTRPSSLRRGRPSVEQSAAITTAIIAVATDMFMSDGFEGASMEAIAARAGIPKTTLYKRFSDKGDLLDAVLRERVAAWERIASRQHSSTTNDLRERLYRHISMMMIWGTKPEVQVVMRLAASAYGLSGRPFARRSFFAYDHMVNLLARAIAELGPTQNIHARDPNRVALALMAFVSGWLESREGMAPATPDDIDAEATLVVNLMIDGAAAW